MDPEITVTLVDAETGASESLPLPLSTTLQQLCELGSALLNVTVVGFAKDNRPLNKNTNNNKTIQQLGIVHGDLLIAQKKQSATTTATTPGGLDFSNLLPSTTSGTAAQAPTGRGGGLDFGSLLNAPSATTTTLPAPVYYQSMNVQECQQANPHPLVFVTLLRSKDHLMKELNYYDPILAAQLKTAASHQDAAQVWKTKMIKGGIARAMKQTNEYHEEQVMQQKLQQGDATAQDYFRKKKQKEKIMQQRFAVMQEYPESFGQVLMLYIDTQINGQHIQAFCDSGAQTTVMSYSIAKQVGIDEWIDEAMSGTAVGVGTTKILGRVHSVNLTIKNHVFPCSITVLEDHPDKPLKFLLGLDMMKRHLCILDLQAGCLKFKLGSGYLEAPFLHEKDLDQDSGGTKGFDANEANAKLLERMKQSDEDE